MVDATKSKRRARRGRGEGSVYRRPDGRWCAMISVGYGADGKRKRRTVYGKTKKAVQDELTRVQSSKLTGTLVDPSRKTVAEYLGKWLDDVARMTVRATTFYNYKAIVKNHINPRIGGVGLQKLTPVHVQALYSEMERDGIGPNPRRLAHAVLHRALKQALKWGLVVRNVCDAVEPPRVPKSEITPLDTSEVGRLLAAADGDRLEALYWLAIGSGLRIGELFGLQWSDIDLSAGTVSVRRTLTEIDGKLALAEPKSAKSRRLVVIGSKVIDKLSGHRKATVAAGLAGSEHVFTNQHGGPLRRSHFHADEFKPLLKRAGLRMVRFHDLRHTHATQLLSQGVHMKVVQERLGHSQISLTMDTYSHVMPSMQIDAAAKMDSLMIADHSENGSQLAVKHA